MQYLQEYMLIDGVHLVRRVASSKVVNYGEASRNFNTF